jgi:DNA-binding IclR family transcriptional regulator
MARPSPSTDRSTRVLSFLAQHSDQRFTLSEISRHLELNKATCHAMLNTLTEAGFLLRYPLDKGYALGPALVTIGQAASEVQARIVDFAQPQMTELSNRFGVQCGASIMSGDTLTYVAVVGKPRPFGPSMTVGESVPCIPPLGGIQVAWSDEARINAWLDRGRVRGARRKALREALDGIKHRGYSLGLARDARTQLSRTLADESVFAGNSTAVREVITELIENLNESAYFVQEVRADERYNIGHVAAPVFGPAGEMLFALTLLGWTEAMSGREVTTIAKTLLRASQEVTSSIHGIVPEKVGQV